MKDFNDKKNIEPKAAEEDNQTSNDETFTAHEAALLLMPGLKKWASRIADEIEKNILEEVESKSLLKCSNKPLMNNRIKRCPFCGATPKIFKKKYKGNSDMCMYRIACSSLSCILEYTGYRWEKKQLIDGWNCRTTKQ